jgi:exosortase/archaeosortase family protein
MPNDEQKVNRYAKFLRTVAPLLAFVIPMLILYYLDPGSFEKTWKGRTYYLFFLWLVSLEIILGWEVLQTSKLGKLNSVRTLVFGIALALPTIYVIIANFYGLNTEIVNWSLHQGIGQGVSDWWAKTMPLPVEYLVFAVTFLAINLIMYGKKGLAEFSISTSLIVIMGSLYLIDNFYIYGQFTPFQLVVPTTTWLSAQVLNLMGYVTQISAINVPPYGWLPNLTALDPKNPARWAHFEIGWPCAGVESLLIYSVTILLFLKKSNIRLWQKGICFLIGAVVTYFINVLRIVTIFVIAMNNGMSSPQVWQFHDYYGQLYSMTWIISYPLIIIGARALWSRIRNKRQAEKNAPKVPTNPAFVTG